MSLFAHSHPDSGALITDYMNLPGMYPHAAGMIASHGPYKSVRDIYQIPNANDNDKKLFKQYASKFTVLPPSRAFLERINAHARAPEAIDGVGLSKETEVVTPSTPLSDICLAQGG